MALAGLRGTGDWGADQRPKNFRDAILWAEPNGQAPLTALMSKMGSASTNDPQFYWWQERQGITRVEFTGVAGVAAVATDTVLDVASGALSLLAGDLLMLDSSTGLGEILEIASDPTTDTAITVVRGASGTTAGAIALNAYLTRQGNVFAEGTGAPNSVIVNPTQLTNYAQIFKTAYEITNTAAKTYTRTGDPIANDKKRKMFKHSIELELAFLFGQPYQTTGANGKPKYYTGGLRSFLNTNVTDFVGTTGATGWTLDNLIAALSAPFDFEAAGAGNERLAFIGNGAATKLNQLVRDTSSTRINFEGQIKVWGMTLTRMVLPQGTIYFRTHPLFNAHPVYTNSMFVINPRGIRYRPFTDTKFKDNIQLPDSDTRKGEWYTHAGIEVDFEETMAYLGNAGG